MIRTTSVIASLPDPKHYSAIAPNKYFRWCDRASDRVRILSPVENPWSQDWLIFPRVVHARSRGIDRTSETFYPSRLELVCQPIGGEHPKGKVLRERYKGHFALSYEPSLLFFAFHTEHREPWLTYTLIEVSDAH